MPRDIPLGPWQVPTDFSPFWTNAVAGLTLGILIIVIYPSLEAQMVKNLPAMQETWVWSLGWSLGREASLKKGMATHSSILAWRISWTEELDRLQSTGINLTKEVKDLCSESCKILMKEIEGDTSRWKDMLWSWIGRIAIVKMTIMPRATYRLNTNPIEMPVIFFIKLEQIVQKLVWKHKRLRIAKTVLRKKGGISLPDFKLC